MSDKELRNSIVDGERLTETEDHEFNAAYEAAMRGKQDTEENRLFAHQEAIRAVREYRSQS